jgi:hypothetical protein
VLWAFVGVERLVGDHEMGVAWEPFLKHRVTMQIRFTNPARKGLEILSYESMSADERSRFLEFCYIRYGVRDPRECYVQIAARVS